MAKILIAVDRTEGSLAVLSVMKNQVRRPQEYILMHVQDLLGGSLMSAMLGKAEMATLKESLEGTPRQQTLTAESEALLAYYQKKLTEFGLPGGRHMITSGNPTEEILRVAREEEVDLIVLGSHRKSLLGRLFFGSTSMEVEKKSGIPVLIAKPWISGGEKRWETSLGFWEAYNLRREKLKMGF